MTFEEIDKVLDDRDRILEDFYFRYGGEFFLFFTGGICYELQNKVYIVPEEKTLQQFVKDIMDSVTQEKNLILQYPQKKESNNIY